jgi:hypothetical protein
VVRIRLQKPPLLRRIIKRTFLVTAILCTLAYFSPISIEIVPKEETAEIEGNKNPKSDSENESEDEDEIEDLDMDDARVKAWLEAYFLPLSRPVLSEKKYYGQEDPEWQLYAAFSRDKERHREVHGMLVCPSLARTLLT